MKLNMNDEQIALEHESVKSRRVAMSGLTAARNMTGLLPELNAIIADYATAKGVVQRPAARRAVCPPTKQLCRLLRCCFVVLTSVQFGWTRC
jgi:hypothetical protein